MPVLENGIKNAVSNVAVPSIIGTTERGFERFEKGGTRRGTVIWFEICRSCVETTVRGIALRAHQAGQEEQRPESSAEARGTRRVRDVEEVYPHIPEREDMAEQVREVGRGGVTSRVIRLKWEARVGLPRRGRNGRGGTKLDL